jgi:hypothetical protein
MAQLHPCPACTCHIKPEERSCPFCGATVPAGFGRRPLAKLSPTATRAAVLFASAVSVTACGGSTESNAPAEHDSGSVTDSGAREETSVVMDTGTADTAEPDTSIVAMYGPAPVMDSGGPDAPAVLYGPAMIDSGASDGETIEGGAVLYGPAMIDSGEG